MARKFLDTSAVARLYVFEADTPAVQAEVVTADETLISRLTLLEYRSAIYGMVRADRIGLVEAHTAVALFGRDLPNFALLELDEATFRPAETLVDAHAVPDNLRPADALQLASALEEHERNPIDAVITTDRVQVQVALANGLVVAP